MKTITLRLYAGTGTVAAVLLIGFLFACPVQAEDLKLDDLYSTVIYLEGREIMKTQKDDIEYEVWLKHPERTLLEPQWVKNIGTGFLIERNRSLYLVTAAHVAKWMDFWAQATVRTTPDRLLTLSLVELSGGSSSILWTYHKEADVAVLPLDPSDRARQAIQDHFLPYQSMMTTQKAPAPSAILTVIGFPLELGIEDRFFPIFQESRASSGLTRYPLSNTRREATFFFMDKPTLYGFSGAPVFQGLTGDVKLVGLVYGTVSDTLGGQFSAVVPSAFIAETLEAASRPKP